MYRQVMFTKQNLGLPTRYVYKTKYKTESLQTRYVYKTKTKYTQTSYVYKTKLKFTNTICLQNKILNIFY